MPLSDRVDERQVEMASKMLNARSLAHFLSRLITKKKLVGAQRNVRESHVNPNHPLYPGKITHKVFISLTPHLFTY